MASKESKSGRSFRITPAPAPDESSVLVGECIHGFRMRKVAGEGGRAYVYQGEQLALKRPVALKILKREFITDAAVIDDFLESGRNGSSLIHPNVVQIYDVVSEGDLHFIVSELLAGQSMGALLARAEALPAVRLCRLGLDMLDAVRSAHAGDMIHGNLTPDNVFMADEGRFRLSDFYHSPRLAPEGKEGFVAPERMRGEECTVAADFFSVGAVLYAASTGVAPYTQEGLAELKAGRGQPPRAAKANPAVPSMLSDLIARMLQAHPAARLVSHDIISEALRTQLESLGETVQSTTFLRKHKELAPSDRRCYRRLPTEMNVKVEQRVTSEDSAAMMWAKLENVSESGALVHSASPLPVGTIVTLEFFLQEKQARINALGIVRWISTSKDDTPAMGVQFLQVATTDRDNLNQFVDDKLANEMLNCLTSTQTHKAILRLLVSRWGEFLPLDEVARNTGTSRKLLGRTLRDFERFGLIRIADDDIEFIKPASERLVAVLMEAQKA